jgi:hypothetical protein
VRERERERGRELEKRANGEIKNILQGANIVKFIKSHRLRWYGNAERMQN